MTGCPPIEALEHPTPEVVAHAETCSACRAIMALISQRDLLSEKPMTATWRRSVYKQRN